MSDDRYEGRPFLKFVDCYVLDAIGLLDATSEARLVAMEAKLQEICGGTGGWRDIVAEQRC